MASEGSVAAFRAILPFPPTINHYWRHAMRRGRACVYVADAGRTYRQRVRSILGGAPKLTGRLRVAVRACPPDRRTRDLDNLCKCLFDSMTSAGVWNDDSQIDELVIVRDKPSRGGLVEVSVEELTTRETNQDERGDLSMFWWLYPQRQWG